eukprot:2981036-Prymnesium_polylepis.2
MSRDTSMVTTLTVRARRHTLPPAKATTPSARTDSASATNHASVSPPNGEYTSSHGTSHCVKCLVRSDRRQAWRAAAAPRLSSPPPHLVPLPQREQPQGHGRRLVPPRSARHHPPPWNARGGTLPPARRVCTSSTIWARWRPRPLAWSPHRRPTCAARSP